MIFINKLTRKVLLITLIFILFFSVHIRSKEVLRLNEYENDIIERVFLIKNNEVPFSIVQRISVRGYKDNIVMYLHTGVKEEKLTNINIVYEDETDHYGGYISKEWFLNRFKDKNINVNLHLVKVSVKNPNDVVAVTGATISSRAVLDGVNYGFDNHKTIIANLGK